MTERESPWMTADEAADYLKYSASSIRRFARNGDLKFAHAGRGDYRFLVEWLDEFMIKSNPVLKPPPKQIIVVKPFKMPDELLQRMERCRKRKAKQENG